MKITLNFQVENMYYNPRFKEKQFDSQEAYKRYYDVITSRINNGKELDINNARNYFFRLMRYADKAGKIDEMTKISISIIEFLVSKQFYSLAGTICSTLIKFNKECNNSKIVEDMAVRGLAIARKADDIVHVAARANDINVVLRQKEPGSDKHVKYLKIQNEALEYICRNYETGTMKNCKTNSKKLAPLENYEDALFYVKLNIAKYALLQDPKYAKNEFEKAKKLFEKIKCKYLPEISKKFEIKIARLEQRYKILGHCK